MNTSEFPTTPGVYIFRDEKGEPIYIGKAKNLKSRTSSYFSKGLLPKTRQMVMAAKTLEYIKVDSEFEALLLEARLVKKYLPKYNSELKDDKSPLYIVITKEDYPRVLSVRQTHLGDIPSRKVYGPFIDTKSVRKVLRLLRRVFPYSNHKLAKRGCIYSQIGQCNPCPSAISTTNDPEERDKLTKAYLSNIRKIQMVLSGKLLTVKREMEREVVQLSEREEFEEAARVQRRLEALGYVTSSVVDAEPYIDDPNFLGDVRARELSQLLRILSKYIDINRLVRIECFDIAHLAGTYPTASMVTFIDGEPDKNYYRHFRVSKETQNNDTLSMQSVIARRMKYFDSWGRPDLIVVDGGKGQVSAVMVVLKGQVPVVGIAKRTETLIIPVGNTFVSVRLPEGYAKRLIQRMRDEAHRFARRYHHKLIARAIAESGKGV